MAISQPTNTTGVNMPTEVAPVARPTDGNTYSWDETTQTWKV